MSVLRSAAEFRPKFATLEDSEAKPYSLRLAEGPGGPPLVCMPSAAPVSGPHEYARLAKNFRGDRDVIALRWPGFAEMESLPETGTVALEFQAAALAEATGDAPVVLVGHSTGGVFARELAGHLEHLGRSPAAVVLIDSYHPKQGTAESSIGLGILTELLEADESGIVIDDVRLTAMVTYLQLVREFEPAPIGCATLLVRATDPIGGDPGDVDWRPSWDLTHDSVDVSGNHLTMMDAFAESTAEAISVWLETVAGKSQANRVSVA